MKTTKVINIYKKLLIIYGYQGWWPITGKKNQTGFTKNGYHPEDYTIPNNSNEKYEIILGTVLTQNTTWKNAATAIEMMIESNICSPSAVLHKSAEDIALAIRSSGYHNQKAKKLKILTNYLVDGKYLNGDKIPGREDLLSLWGIGPETADSILLYAYKTPEVVIDAYTHRIFTRIGVVEKQQNYEALKRFFTDNFYGTVKEINEYHALIVKHAKTYCRKKPVCLDCPFNRECSYAIQ